MLSFFKLISIRPGRHDALISLCDRYSYYVKIHFRYQNGLIYAELYTFKTNTFKTIHDNINTAFKAVCTFHPFINI